MFWAVKTGFRAPLLAPVPGHDPLTRVVDRAMLAAGLATFGRAQLDCVDGGFDRRLLALQLPTELARQRLALWDQNPLLDEGARAQNEAHNLLHDRPVGGIIRA